MKKLLNIAAILLMGTMAKAQSITDCLQQLALDYQKLANMKNVLTEQYRGFSVLTTGYTAVRDVSKGNFSLNEAFLDGLYLVSPTVRKYPKVQLIISNQTQLVATVSNLKKNVATTKFSSEEILSVTSILNNVVTRSLDNLDALTLIMADNKLRMGDAERLRLIDQLYNETQEQLAFTRRFDAQMSATVRRRTATQQDQTNVRKLYNLN